MSTPSRKAPPWSPWVPPEWELADASSIQALARGEANPDQQKRALDFIVNKLARTYDLSFCPGPEGDRETSMSEGRRFVGLQIVKLINVNTSLLRRNK